MGLRTSRHDEQQPKILYNARHSPFRFAQLTRFGHHEPRIVQVVILDAEPRDATDGTAWPPRIHWSEAKSLQVRLGRHPDSPLPHRVKEARAVRGPQMPPRRAGQRLHYSARGLRASRRDETFGRQGGRSTIGIGRRSAGEMMGPGLRSWLEHLPAPSRWLGVVSKCLFGTGREAKGVETSKPRRAQRRHRRTILSSWGFSWLA